MKREEDAVLWTAVRLPNKAGGGGKYWTEYAPPAGDAAVEDVGHSAPTLDASWPLP